MLSISRGPASGRQQSLVSLETLLAVVKSVEGCCPCSLGFCYVCIASAAWREQLGHIHDCILAS